MIIIPAIDLMGGHVVRLKRGEAKARTVYHTDPVEWARELVHQKAARLHVVDLDGAFTGRPAHTPLIERIAKVAGVPIQVGGGLRTVEAIDELIRAGVSAVVLGTAALTDPKWLADVLSRWGERIAVGLDARGGRVAIEGWTRTGSTTAVAMASQLKDAGVGRLVYTNVSRNGALLGLDVGGAREVARAFGGPITVSGGIGSIADLREIKALGVPGIDSCIVGKALYDGLFTLGEAMEAVR